MDHSVKSLLTGNGYMAVCGAFYLAWWIVVFRPPKPRSSPLGWVLLALAFLAGMAGFYQMGRALSADVPVIQPGVENRWILAGGLGVYLLLLAGTRLLFHRPVTSELLIITGWTVLELCTVNFLYRCGGLPKPAGLLLAGLVLSAMAASLLCYLLYYRLPYTAGFLDGCVPLAAAILTIVLINLTASRIP